MNDAVKPAGSSWTSHMRLDTGLMVAILLLSFAAKFVVLDPVGPVIFWDELLYKLGADALAGRGDYPSGHYPFLYPLLLAPAIASGAGYEGIFVINALATSALVPACWLLAKACGAKWAWPGAAIAAVLPIQFTFPTQLMAENLLVPLFTFCIWYAVRAKPVGWPSAFVFGLMLAGIYLTKYLALPAVPVLWAMWLFGLSRNGVARRDLLPPAASSALGIVALLLAWVLYARANGIGTGAAFGANVYDGYADRDAITFDAVVLWTTAYVAAMVLVVGPFLYRFFEAGVHLARHPVRRLGESAFYRLVLLCLLFLGGYVLVCVQHSVQLAMNYPDPQRIVARYFMQIVPAVFVAGMVHTLADNRIGRLGLLPGFLASAALAALVVAAHGVLYKDLVWDLPDWFAAIPLYSADILGYRGGIAFWLLLALVLLGPLAATGRPGRWLLAMGSIALVVLSTAAVNHESEKFTIPRPVHAKALLPHVAASLEKAGEGSVLVILEHPGISTTELQHGLVFWGMDGQRVQVAGPMQTSGFRRDVEAVYRISGKPIEHLPLVRAYHDGQSGTGYIYRDRIPTGQDVETDVDERVSFGIAPAAVCGGAGRVVAELSWNVPDEVARQVSVFMRSADGTERIFAMAGSTGSQKTGPWVSVGTEFTLRNSQSGQLLSSLRVAAAECE